VNTGGFLDLEEGVDARVYARVSVTLRDASAIDGPATSL